MLGWFCNNHCLCMVLSIDLFGESSLNRPMTPILLTGEGSRGGVHVPEVGFTPSKHVWHNLWN